MAGFTLHDLASGRDGTKCTSYTAWPCEYLRQYDPQTLLTSIKVQKVIAQASLDKRLASCCQATRKQNKPRKRSCFIFPERNCESLPLNLDKHINFKKRRKRHKSRCVDPFYIKDIDDIDILIATVNTENSEENISCKPEISRNSLPLRPSPEEGLNENKDVKGKQEAEGYEKTDAEMEQGEQSGNRAAHFTVFVRQLNNEIVTVPLRLSDTLVQLRTVIKCPAAEVKFYHCGKQLKEDASLQEQGVQCDSNIELHVALQGGADNDPDSRPVEPDLSDNMEEWSEDDVEIKDHYWNASFDPDDLSVPFAFNMSDLTAESFEHLKVSDSDHESDQAPESEQRELEESASVPLSLTQPMQYDKSGEYHNAEVLGVSVNDKERAKFEEELTSFIDRCFQQKAQNEAAKTCIGPPIFVKVSGMKESRYVIEVDITPKAMECGSLAFKVRLPRLTRGKKQGYYDPKYYERVGSSSCLVTDVDLADETFFERDYEIIADTFRNFADDFKIDRLLYIAESDAMLHGWNIKLEEVYAEDKHRSRGIVGMPWNHVNESIKQFVGVAEEGEGMLPTSTGGGVPLKERDRKLWKYLDIVCQNQCENSEMLTNKEALERHRQEKEEEFWKGKKVDWWNFWFTDSHTAVNGQVLTRDDHENLKTKVRNNLRGDIEGEWLRVVNIVQLFHHPGAGGSTMARHVLWDLRKEYRCAVVTSPTLETCEQILDLYSYEEPKSENCRPVLILVEDIDAAELRRFKVEIESVINKRLAEKENDVNKALKIMTTAYDRFGDGILAQQAARLFSIKARNFEKARHYARQGATDKRNSYTLDTVGQVEKEEFICRFQSNIERQSELSPEHAKEAIKLAFQAMSYFHNAQRANYEEGARNHAGFVGEVQVCFLLLKLLQCFPLFKGEEGRKYLYACLMGNKAPPSPIKDCWDEHQSGFRQLHDRMDKALKYIANLETYYKHDLNASKLPLGRSNVNTAYLIDSPETKKFLVANYRNYALYFCMSSDVDLNDVRDEAVKCELRRSQVAALRGNNFFNIFELVARKHIDTLRRIRDMLKANVNTPELRHKKPSDIQNYILVNLALASIDKQLTGIPSLNELCKLAERLVDMCDGSEAYPYFLIYMFMWPNLNMSVDYKHSKFKDALKKLEEIHRKHSRSREEQKPHHKIQATEYQPRASTLFFLGKTTRTVQQFVYVGQLPPIRHHALFVMRGLQTSVKRDQFWKNPAIPQILQRLTGTQIRGTIYVKNVKLTGRSREVDNIEVRPALPIRSGSRIEEVSFYLGFSWAGPVAYDVQRLSDDTAFHSQSTMTDTLETDELVAPEEETQFDYEQFQAEMANHQATLDSIEELKKRRDKGEALNKKERKKVESEGDVLKKMNDLIQQCREHLESNIQQI
ncbi:sterile alpha motif [Branchiostoma belcheri]|nr:sterile alpha motif [Branchiostoma belcheri]